MRTQPGHCLTSQIERIADKRMDEISREKEEYFADGVLWSDNHSHTSSDTKTVFERITCGSELDLARACGPISIECRELPPRTVPRFEHDIIFIRLECIQAKGVSCGVYASRVYLYPYSWLLVRNVDERGSSTRVSGFRRYCPPGHLCRLATKVSCPSTLSQMK